MTADARYAAGLAGVALAAASAAAALPQHRTAIWVALGIAMLVQGPLGWWLVRSLGSEGLLWVWGLGMITRVALLAAAAWIVAPRLGLAPGPLLMALASVVLALLGIEVIVMAHQVKHRGVR
jgi:hypothetical protein